MHLRERGDTSRDIKRAVADVQSREQIRSVIGQSVRGLDRIDRAMILGAYAEGAREEHAHFAGTVEDFAEFVCGERSTRFSGSTHLIGMPSVDIRQIIP